MVSKVLIEVSVNIKFNNLMSNRYYSFNGEEMLFRREVSCQQLRVNEKGQE